MMLSSDVDRLPWHLQLELRQIGAMLFESFDAMVKGRCSEHLRAGRILALVLYGPHASEDWENIEPGEALHLTAIVNYSRLARRKSDWRIIRDRLRQAWEYREIAQPVRLSVEGLDRVNRCLGSGIPHYIGLVERGIALYQAEGLHLQAPRRLPVEQRVVRSAAEYLRWHERGRGFLAGAAFYRDQDNAPMAALLLHQACEHFYLSVLWTLTLHGPRIHALDELREAAEALDNDLSEAWPRGAPFERRAFGCIRRAYIEARYGQSYRISSLELAWAFGRVQALKNAAMRVCIKHWISLVIGRARPLLSAPIG